MMKRNEKLRLALGAALLAAALHPAREARQ